MCPNICQKKNPTDFILKKNIKCQNRSLWFKYTVVDTHVSLKGWQKFFITLFQCNQHYKMQGSDQKPNHVIVFVSDFVSIYFTFLDWRESLKAEFALCTITQHYKANRFLSTFTFTLVSSAKKHRTIGLICCGPVKTLNGNQCALSAEINSSPVNVSRAVQPPREQRMTKHSAWPSDSITAARPEIIQLKRFFFIVWEMITVKRIIWAFSKHCFNLLRAHVCFQTDPNVEAAESWELMGDLLSCSTAIVAHYSLQQLCDFQTFICLTGSERHQAFFEGMHFTYHLSCQNFRLRSIYDEKWQFVVVWLHLGNDMHSRSCAGSVLWMSLSYYQIKI